MIVTEKDTEDELRYYSIRKDIETYGNWWIESFIWENNFNEYNNIKLYKEFMVALVNILFLKNRVANINSKTRAI